MRIVSTILLAALCVQAHAETGIRAANRQLRLSVGAQTIDYVEQDNYGQTSNGVLDSEKGTQPGLRIDYTLQGDGLGIKDLYGSMSYATFSGQTHYDGYLQNLYTGALTPYQSETKDRSDDYQFRLGKGFVFFNTRSLQLTPYVAYSSRQWKRYLSPDNAYGYHETYSHGAGSLGLLSQFALTQHLVASVDASYGKTFNAKMKVENYEVFHLGSKPIYDIGVGLDYAIGTTWHVFGQYQYSEFRYGESPVDQYGYYEPNSKTKLSQLYLGVGYGF